MGVVLFGVPLTRGPSAASIVTRAIGATVLPDYADSAPIQADANFSALMASSGHRTVAGGLGSLLRCLTGRVIGDHYHGDFPIGTFLING